MNNRPNSIKVKRNIDLPDSSENSNNSVIDKLFATVRSIRHGTVQVHIQDGKIIQIDRTDKIRLR
ncbi:MAG: DUF2292 domain-containing protein [Candidatus Omnitrophica bacterium]|nr:DUF2292 domain-containing protein [Candidatus Omnitrophota bacterium]